MNYSVSEINSHFKIKVNVRNFQGKYITKLVGVKGLNKLVGSDLACRLVGLLKSHTQIIQKQ